MRILSKKEVQESQSLEKKIQIDEGMRLARRVDGLRELAAAEETNIRKFRDNSLKAIQEEVAKLQEKVKKLREQATTLSDQRDLLKKPLTQEKQVIAEERIALKEERERNFVATLALEKESNAIQKRLEIAENKELQAFEAEHKAQKALEGLESFRKDFEQASEATNLFVEARLKELKDAESTFRSREETLSAKERDIENRAKSQDIREKQLNILSRQLDDRQQTLLRTEQRLHGNRPT